MTESTKWLPFTKLDSLSLITGFEEDEPIVMDIAPTMKRIVHGGKTYYRMDNCRDVLDDGTHRAVYLKEGYAKERSRRMQLEASNASP